MAEEETTAEEKYPKDELPGIPKQIGKKINGMAFMLQQLRSVNEGSEEMSQEELIVTEETSVEVEALSDTTQKLNRKERRALLQKRHAETNIEEEHSVEKEEPPAKILCQIVPVSYSFENPVLVCKEDKAFTKKVPDFGFAAQKYSNNYVKLVKFSPGGQYVASTSQDRIARIFSFDKLTQQISTIASLALGGLPYDSVWHPCGDLLATTARLHPIHLWNPSGEIEASYRGIDHLDELTAAQTMTFSNDGLKMYAGYNKCIKIWDVRRPGKQKYEIKTWRKQPYSEGQKARVSSISMHPYFDGVYAVGTYGPTIGLYSDRTNFVECLFSGDFQAVTQIKYSLDGMKLYSCGRRTGTIQCFDLRNPGSVLFTLHRPFETQQKVYFDIDRAEKYLFCGTSNGEIAVFDLQEGEAERKPKTVLKISESSVPCISLHSDLPIVAACTGERVFPYPRVGTEEESDEEPNFLRKYLDCKSEADLENTIQLWNFSSNNKEE